MKNSIRLTEQCGMAAFFRPVLKQRIARVKTWENKTVLFNIFLRESKTGIFLKTAEGKNVV